MASLSATFAFITPVMRACVACLREPSNGRRGNERRGTYCTYSAKQRGTSWLVCAIGLAALSNSFSITVCRIKWYSAEQWRQSRRVPARRRQVPATHRQVPAKHRQVPARHRQVPAKHTTQRTSGFVRPLQCQRVTRPRDRPSDSPIFNSMVAIYPQADIFLDPASTSVNVFPQSRSNYSKFGHIQGGVRCNGPAATHSQAGPVLGIRMRTYWAGH